MISESRILSVQKTHISCIFKIGFEAMPCFEERRPRPNASHCSDALGRDTQESGGFHGSGNAGYHPHAPSARGQVR